MSSICSSERPRVSGTQRSTNSSEATLITAAMKKVLPDAKFIDLTPAHPIYHTFFEIETFDIVQQYYDPGRPIFRAIFEDNDPKKRMLCMINYNTDISEFWEWSPSGFKPISESNEAYQIGVNWIIYGMTR